MHRENENNKINHPNSRGSNSPSNISKSFSPDNQNKYLQLRRDYSKFAHREINVQILGFIFVFFSFFIELIIFFIVRKALRIINPKIIMRIFFIFGILGIITVLTIVQIIIIHKWNRNIKEKKHSLSYMNYYIINQSKILKIIILTIIVFCLLFIRVFSRYRLPVAEDYRKLVNFYRLLLRLSWLLVIGLLILEVFQFGKWNKRIKAVKSIEAKIMNEISGFDNLVDLTEKKNDI